MSRRLRLIAVGLLVAGCSNATVGDSGEGAGDDAVGLTADDGSDDGDDGVDGARAGGALVLNEVASNAEDSDDWIELYNGTNVTAALSGWGLTDERQEGVTPWLFPADILLESGEYLLVWASDAENEHDGDGLHTDFKLSGSDGETLWLLDAHSAVVDEVLFPPMNGGQSFARLPDGDGRWALTEPPTPEAPND